MAIHKLIIDDEDETDFQLVAIHTSLEEHRLAFFLNQKLPILLSKNQKGFELKSKLGASLISQFQFINHSLEEAWYLYQNKNELQVKKQDFTENLFENEPLHSSKIEYIISEYKKADYILKIESSETNQNKLIEKIKQIDKIAAVYFIDIKKIKTKNNLIF